MPFYSAEELVFEPDELRFVSRQFQVVLCIQGEANIPHYAKQLKSNSRNAETRRKYKQFVHWENGFNILYAIIFCTDGPELEINNRHAVAKEQLTQVEGMKPSKIRNRQHQGDRRERLGECLFWETAI